MTEMQSLSPLMAQGEPPMPTAAKLGDQVEGLIAPEVQPRGDQDAQQGPRLQQQQQQLPVYQRHTQSSKLHALVDPESESAAAISALFRQYDRPGVGPNRLPQLANYSRSVGESLKDLVARKRQIFLAQMSLDTKHGEIAKLRQRTQQWDDALTASEKALEADSKRFEDYLKDNDARLQEALRRADAQVRQRAEKAAEAKRLAAAIAAMQSDVGKIEEQLEECKRLKAFLDGVTPPEWFDRLAAARAAKEAAMRAAWQAECDAIAQCKQAAQEFQRQAEHNLKCARTQQQFERAQHTQREAAAALQQALGVQEPAEPDYSAEHGEANELYWQDPAQLLAVFSQLEASNMTQIQAAQHAEATLQAARAQHEHSVAVLDSRAATLRREVAELEAAVEASRACCARLQEAAQHNSAEQGSGSSQETAHDAGAESSQQAAAVQQRHLLHQPHQQAHSWAALAAAVAATYKAAGFAAHGNMPPLQLLEKVELQLEEWLAQLGAPGSPLALHVEQVERAREKERRQAARADKLAAQRAQQEARVARVLARAAAPKFQKSGKQVMTRSVLEREEQAAAAAPDEAGDEELRAFLALVDEGIPSD